MHATFDDAMQIIVAGKFGDDIADDPVRGAIHEHAQSINPNILALMVMQNLPQPDEHISPEKVAFWVQVAKELGPDWISQWRLAGELMERLDEICHT